MQLFLFVLYIHFCWLGATTKRVEKQNNNNNEIIWKCLCLLAQHLWALESCFPGCCHLVLPQIVFPAPKPLSPTKFLFFRPFSPFFIYFFPFFVNLFFSAAAARAAFGGLVFEWCFGFITSRFLLSFSVTHFPFRTDPPARTLDGPRPWTSSYSVSVGNVYHFRLSLRQQRRGYNEVFVSWTKKKNLGVTGGQKIGTRYMRCMSQFFPFFFFFLVSLLLPPKSPFV